MTKPDTGGRGEGRSSDLVMVEREVLANAVSELKNLLAMCEGEVPSLLEDHFSYPKIVDAIEAGERALQSVEGGVQGAAKQESCPESAPRTETDVRWAVNYLLEQIAAKFEAWDTMDLWRSDAANLVRSFKHDLTKTPSADHDAGNLRGLAEPNHHQPHAVSQGWRDDMENVPDDERVLVRNELWFDTHGEVQIAMLVDGDWTFDSEMSLAHLTDDDVAMGGEFELTAKDFQPTHWMPLPAPPSPAKTGGAS